MHVDMGAETGDKIIIGDSSTPLTQGSSSGAYSLVITNDVQRQLVVMSFMI